jgi:hypothetical protein
MDTFRAVLDFPILDSVPEALLVWDVPFGEA